MRHILALMAAILFAAPAAAVSGNICGLNVASDQGLDSADYVYYQVDSFLEEYNRILAKSYESNEECWAAVNKLLKDTPFVTEYGFSKNGAPPAFHNWYVDWFNGTFMNNDPDAIRSKFIQLKRDSLLGEEI